MSDAAPKMTLLTSEDKGNIMSHLVLRVLENLGVSITGLHSADRAGCENLPWRELSFSVLVIIKKKSQNRMAVKDGCM